MESRGSNIAIVSLYLIFGSLISNIEVSQKSNLAIISLYSLMISWPNIEYGDRNRWIYLKNRYIRWWNSTRISNLAKISPYSIFWQVVEVTRISNLAINSPYSIFGPVTSNIRGNFPIFEVTEPAPPFPTLQAVVILWRIFDIRAQNDHVNSKLDM